MSGIAKASEKMKKKISFGDYALSTDENLLPKVDARKVYSLSKDDTVMLQKIFSYRLSTQNQTSISEIMSEAIILLYNQEIKNPG